jgi:nucleoside-triphosphatase THEP1
VDRCGQKTGIWGVDVLTGERRILARTDRNLGGPEVGPYSFDDGALAWALGVVSNAVGNSDLLVVDEMGKLELWRDIGLAPILPRLASGEVGRSLVLVRDSLLSELRARLGPVDQVVFRATTENRADLPPRILARLIGCGS